MKSPLRKSRTLSMDFDPVQIKFDRLLPKDSLHSDT